MVNTIRGWSFCKKTTQVSYGELTVHVLLVSFVCVSVFLWDCVVCLWLCVLEEEGEEEGEIVWCGVLCVCIGLLCVVVFKDVCRTPNHILNSDTHAHVFISHPHGCEQKP